jgi:hypothetical protein
VVRTSRALKRLAIASLICVLHVVCLSQLRADKPYFVTYDDEMEEPGNLEVSLNPVIGLPQSGHRFLGLWTEFEYGVKGWWTTEVYIDGQTTRGESTILTGFRWENRFRPLAGQHWINPVLYIEFESISGADKTLLEVVNHDSVEDLATPNAEAQSEKEHEVEAKLILSSNYRGWNISENFISEKNLGHEPWEFGYAVGMSRPLALAMSPRPCNLCRENFQAGAELYGGLGTWDQFGFRETAHYLAPVLVWNLPRRATFRISPTFGLNGNAARALIRFGVAWEIPNFNRALRRWFR